MNTIKCPYCKYQYLPGEIFYPKRYLGQPKNIVRNSIGDILGYEGIKEENSEEYVCDNCNKKFNVIVKHSFSSKKIDNKAEDVEISSNIGIFE